MRGKKKQQQRQPSKRKTGLTGGPKRSMKSQEERKLNQNIPEGWKRRKGWKKEKKMEG